jgi:hypothetical protein
MIESRDRRSQQEQNESKSPSILDGALQKSKNSFHASVALDVASPANWGARVAPEPSGDLRAAPFHFARRMPAHASGAPPLPGGCPPEMKHHHRSREDTTADPWRILRTRLGLSWLARTSQDFVADLHRSRFLRCLALLQLRENFVVVLDIARSVTLPEAVGAARIAATILSVSVSVMAVCSWLVGVVAPARRVAFTPLRRKQSAGAPEVSTQRIACGKDPPSSTRVYVGILAKRWPRRGAQV